MNTTENIRLLSVALLLACSQVVMAQNSLVEKFKKFQEEKKKEYVDFRKEALKKYTDFVRQTWEEFHGEPAMVLPKEEEIVPVLADTSDVATNSFWGDLKKLLGKKEGKRSQVKQVKGEGENLGCQQVIQAEPLHPQPQPIAEVVESRERANEYRTFPIFGTDFRVRIGDDCRPPIRSLESDSVADAMRVFTQPQYDNLLYDCLQERKKYSLSDWAYYQMLKGLTQQFYGTESNEGALVFAFLYSQSGYKMRMAHDKKHLIILVASQHYIYDREYLYVKGERFYFLDGNKLGEHTYLCKASFPKESSMSLQISAKQEFLPHPTPQRTITSTENKNFSFTVTLNKNYIDFYDTYPRSTIGNNFMTQWVMYAETPLEKGLKAQLYPPMREKLKGLSQLDAVQQLLYWVQTGLEYMFDDEVWGGDRPFFGEESLFYPYCDCEDRAILFSHLVRDLVGLDVALVYYPGHLASAVAFTDEVKGDYYTSDDGRKFTVCDPTIVPGKVGMTMEIVDGSKATMMLLKRDN